ncbi:hypothetical protein PINS_up008755 [Pythium insidiosum]|nr:hypothetical protein PINS_up008755 [Pythium insidiosum]
MGNLASWCFVSDEERQVCEANEREFARIQRQADERKCERERLRCQEVERKRQQAIRHENWVRQQALQRQLREREDARREQYRQQLLHYDGPATVASSDGTFVEFRLLNTRVALKLFDEVPGGALLTFTQDLHAPSQKWSTHMVGKFQCKLQKSLKNRKGGICSSWTSGKIYTEIFFQDPNHPHDSYKAVVRVWTQCCRNCNAKVLPRMEEDIYLERVISRLQLWMGLRSPIHVEKPVPSGLPPHRQDLCSACKAGKCQMTKISQSDTRRR